MNDLPWVALFALVCFAFSSYTAAAVILQLAGCDVPYLCKIAVSAQAQVRCTDTRKLNITQ